MDREIKFFEAIQEATDQIMGLDETVYVIGLGVPDPKGLFGTTLNLEEKYGSHRVMDMPTSENAMTGIIIGSALKGLRPIMTHQRIDFSLLSLDQIINNASKWHYMFGKKAQVPIVIRALLGRGWGQGPQHSQTLHSIFAHIPGLKVVMPSNCYNAKGLFISAVQDNNPVIFLEHRWLHNTFGIVPEEVYSVPLGKAKVMKEGKDISIISCSHMILEALKAVNLLEEEGISAELIDLRTIKPFDKEAILESVRKTGRVLVLDPDWKTCGFAAEILATIVEEAMDCLHIPPVRMTYPDKPCPTSWALANHYYPTVEGIALKVCDMMMKGSRVKLLLQKMIENQKRPLDVPDKFFTGPF